MNLIVQFILVCGFVPLVIISALLFGQEKDKKP
jgi:hypothetical protein